MRCSPWGHKESDTTERLNSTETRQVTWDRDLPPLPSPWPELWKVPWPRPGVTREKPAGGYEGPGLPGEGSAQRSHSRATR